MPPLAATKTPLDGTQLGVFAWADGNTASGGTGQAIGTDTCPASSTEAYHIHAHLAIFQNGQQLAVPSRIGLLPTCSYTTHTHDRSGVIHVEADAQPTAPFTLGEVFAVWGMPLDATHVATITDPSIVVYVNDNGSVAQWTGNIGDIELLAHREITIQIGTPLTTLPTYDFTALNP